MAHEELEGPLSQSFIFDVCNNVFFPEPLRSSDVSSCSVGVSGCCFDDNYAELCFSSIPSDMIIASLEDPTSTTNAASVLSALPESNPDSDTSDPTSLNFPPTLSIQSYSALNQQDQPNSSSLQSQIQLPDPANPAHLAGFSAYSPKSIAVLPPPSPSLPPQVLLPVFEEDSFCPTQSYLCVDSTSPSSCSLLDHNDMGSVYGGNLNMGMSTVAAEASAMFSSQDWEFQETNGSVHGSKSVYSSGEFQVLNENHRQQQVGASGSYSSTTAQHTAEISSLDESSLKVGRLSAEERKEKIHRYMKKRNERNFTKKIKYACRKTLADSRPRVRGRFAKNDEIVEAARSSFMHQEDEDEVGVKQEEAMLDSSDIFAHISGVNSFRFSYPIQPWI